MEDANGVVASASYNDALDRPTQVIRANTQGQSDPNRSQTSFAYDPGNRLITTSSDQLSYGDNQLKSELRYDGLGRTMETRSYETATAYISVAQQYDALGRAAQVSNPYRAGDTVRWTTTGYDGLGRVVAVTTPDGATVGTAYDGARVLVTDQAGKQRISETDALGRLRNVWEVAAADGATETVSFPGASVSAGYRTKYAYDTLDDLTTVTQQVGTSGTIQTRSFVYDSLKRLTAATNPESGQTSYQYDENGNLRFKTEARTVKTTLTYDALNRVVTKTYAGTSAEGISAANATPVVNYYYDGQGLPSGAPSFVRGQATGRLVAVTYAGGSQGNYYSYDSLGRVAVSYQQTAGPNYQVGYQYNLAGALSAQTYPSGRVVTNGYDNAGRLNDVRLSGRQWSYGGQFGYAAHGAVKELKLGNGLWEQMTFNTRLQVTQIGVGTAVGDLSKLKLDYGYGTTNNNGNVLSQTITAPGLSVGQTYQYDALNRLTEAKENNGTSWQQNYAYDRFGNRVVLEGSYFPQWQLTPKDLTVNVDAATNRLRAPYWQYDVAGNQTRDAGWQNFAYDGENLVVSVRTDQGTVYASYSYDGEGRRVQKVANGSTTVFVYNAAGQLIAEYANATPAAGTGGTKYLTADHLGSTRLVTSGGRGDVKARYDYLPFGEEIGADRGGRGGGVGHNAGETLRQRFTGYERDSESGLDFAQARYYANVQGRFTSSDEFQGGPREVFILGSGSSTKQALPYAEIANPQSLNKYHCSYNNPLRYVDPDGHMPDGDGDIVTTIIKTVTQTVDAVTQVFGSLFERAQRGANGGNPNANVDPNHPLGGREQFLNDLAQDAAKRGELIGKMASLADPTGTTQAAVGIVKGDKVEAGIGMAGMLLGPFGRAGTASARAAVEVIGKAGTHEAITVAGKEVIPTRQVAEKLIAAAGGTIK